MKENEATDDSGVETFDEMKKVVIEKSSLEEKKENALENLLNQEAKSEESQQQAHAKIESEGGEILEVSSKTLSEPSDETKGASTTLSAPTTGANEKQIAATAATKTRTITAVNALCTFSAENTTTKKIIAAPNSRAILSHHGLLTHEDIDKKTVDKTPKEYAMARLNH